MSGGAIWQKALGMMMVVLLSGAGLAAECRQYLLSSSTLWPLPGHDQKVSEEIYDALLAQELKAAAGSNSMAVDFAWDGLSSVEALAAHWQVHQGLQQYYSQLAQSCSEKGAPDISYFFTPAKQRQLAARHLAAYQAYFKRLRQRCTEANLPWQVEVVPTPWGKQTALVLTLSVGQIFAAEEEAVWHERASMRVANFARQQLKKIWAALGIKQGAVKLVYLDLQIAQTAELQQFSLAGLGQIGAMRAGNLIFLPSMQFADEVQSIPRVMHELIHYRTAWQHPRVVAQSAGQPALGKVSYGREVSFSEIDAWPETYRFTKNWGTNLLAATEDPAVQDRLRTVLNLHLRNMRQQWPSVAFWLEQHLAAAENILRRSDVLEYLAATWRPYDVFTQQAAQAGEEKFLQGKIFYPLADAPAGTQTIYGWEQNIYDWPVLLSASPGLRLDPTQDSFTDDVRPLLREHLAAAVAAEKQRLSLAQAFFAQVADDQF